jgi:hypothetical protein
MIGLAAVIAMPAVHEEVQERAQEQEREREDAEEVRGVLGDEEEGSDGEESDQNPECFGSQPGETVRCEIGLRVHE